MIALFQDEVVIASAEFDEYLENQVAVIAPSPIPQAFNGFRPGMQDVVVRVVESVQSESEKAVRAAWKQGQELSRMKSDLKRSEYNILLSQLGWLPGLANKYIKLAKTFSGFAVEKLLKIEITTLFALCAKTYSGVVEKLLEMQDITQEMVVRLMKEAREAAAKLKPPKKPQDPITGWQQDPSGGGRHYGINLYDEGAAMKVERLAQEKNCLPHRVIVEAITAFEDVNPTVPEDFVAQLRHTEEKMQQELQQTRAELKEAVDEMRSRHIEMEKRIISQEQEIKLRDARIAELEVLLEDSASARANPDVAFDDFGVSAQSKSSSTSTAFAVGDIVRHHKVAAWQYEVVAYLGEGEYELKKFGEKGARYTTRLKENQLLPL